MSTLLIWVFSYLMICSFSGSLYWNAIFHINIVCLYMFSIEIKNTVYLHSDVGIVLISWRYKDWTNWK